jgi:hypothetical protein
MEGVALMVWGVVAAPALPVALGALSGAPGLGPQVVLRGCDRCCRRRCDRAR